jgi:hypothetical protein
MFFLIKAHWDKLNKDIWDSIEKSVLSPSDIYIELLRYMNEKFGSPASVEALNDPKLAREEFRELSAPLDETSCIVALEGFYEVLLQFGSQIAQKYQAKLNQYIEEHNLRYRLTPQCEFKLTLPGLIMTQQAYLRNSIHQNSERIECLTELENGLSNITDVDGEKNCIRIASNLLEGLVLDKANIGGVTLSLALDRCPNLFPHSSLKECVKNIYRFSCDYPNIRHPGNPANRIRALKKDDALLIIAVTLGLSSFISNDNAGETLLSGNL